MFLIIGSGSLENELRDLINKNDILIAWGWRFKYKTKINITLGEEESKEINDVYLEYENLGEGLVVQAVEQNIRAIATNAPVLKTYNEPLAIVNDVDKFLNRPVRIQAKFDKLYPQFQVQKINFKFTEDDFEFIENFIKEMLPNTKVLYGGSANVSNIEMLNKIGQIDGYLLGGLSLKPEDLQKFLDIMKN